MTGLERPSETIGIVGAGALGTLLADALARSGRRVLVSTRAETRRSALARDLPSVSLAKQASEFEVARFIFVCVKAYDTGVVAGALAPILGAAARAPAVCSIQNGWGPMRVLAEALPGTPLLAGVTSLGAFLDTEGRLRASLDGMTRIAPFGSTDRGHAAAAAEVLEGAGLRAEVRDRAEPILWEKLTLNAAVNPLTALLQCRNGALMESPGLLAVARSAALEAARVGTRLGYLGPDHDAPGALDRLLRETAGNRSSMAQDLAAGRRTEVEEILGAVIQEARSLGEPTPVLEALLTLVRSAEQTKRGGR